MRKINQDIQSLIPIEFQSKNGSKMRLYVRVETVKKNLQLNLCLIFFFLIKYYLKIRSSRRLLGIQKWDRNDLDQFSKLMFISHEVGNFVSTMTNSQNILKLDKKIYPKYFTVQEWPLSVFSKSEKNFLYDLKMLKLGRSPIFCSSKEPSRSRICDFPFDSVIKIY